MTPREPAAELAALERLPRQSIPDDGNIGRHNAGQWRNASGHVEVIGLEAARAVLRAAAHRSDVALDVERLASAITMHSIAQRTNGPDAYFGHKCMGDCAADIAREYAALAKEPSDA